MSSELSLPRPGMRLNVVINGMLNCNTSCIISIGIVFVGVGILVTSSMTYDVTALSKTLAIGPMMIIVGLFFFINGIYRLRQERTCKCLQRNRSISLDTVSPDNISNTFNQTRVIFLPSSVNMYFN